MRVTRTSGSKDCGTVGYTVVVCAHIRLAGLELPPHRTDGQDVAPRPNHGCCGRGPLDPYQERANFRILERLSTRSSVSPMIRFNCRRKKLRAHSAFAL